MQNIISAEEMKNILLYISQQMINQYIDEIRELDAAIGDGDLGITIKKGSQALLNQLEKEKATDVGTVLKKAGMIFTEANPSTFSVLGGTGLMYAGKVVKGQESISMADVPEMIRSAQEGIEKRGKGHVGEKTMLDAFNEIQMMFEESKTFASFITLLEKMTEAAEKGMLKTKDMIAKKGRAKAFGQRTIGEVDPGAKVTYFFFSEFYHYLKNKE